MGIKIQMPPKGWVSGTQGQADIFLINSLGDTKWLQTARQASDTSV